jgi:hypothetical protein
MMRIEWMSVGVVGVKPFTYTFRHLIEHAFVEVEAT